MAKSFVDPLIFKVWNRLQEGTTLAIYRPLIELTGSVKAAVFLSQLVYWTRHGVDVETSNGWIKKTSKEATRETGLTIYEQDTARKILTDKGFIESQRQGMGALLNYRVNLQNLGTALAELLQIDTDGYELNLTNIRNQASSIFRNYFGKAVAYHRDLAHLTGDINAAVMLSIAFREVINNYQQCGQAIASLMISDWTSRCGLSYKEQANARKKLKNKLIIKESHLLNNRRIFIEILSKNILAFFNSKLVVIKNNIKKYDKNSYIYSQLAEKEHAVSAISAYEENQALPPGEYSMTFRFGKRSNTDSGKGQIQIKEKVKYRLCKKDNTDSGKRQIVYKEGLHHKNNYTKAFVKAASETVSINGFDVVVVDDPKKLKINFNPEAIIWPKQFNLAERKRALQMVDQRLDLKDQDSVQTLLDEISGQYDVRNPLGLLYKLIAECNRNNFIPTVADRVQAKRKTQEQIRAVNEANEKAVNQQFSKKTGENFVRGTEFQRQSIDEMRKRLNMKILDS